MGRAIQYLFVAAAVATIIGVLFVCAQWVTRKKKPAHEEAMTTTGRLRDREAENIKRMREKNPREFALAEDVLDLAARIFSSRPVRPPNGDILVGRIALGLIIKIITVFWEVICATEKALPSSSQVRELAEALISLVYLTERRFVCTRTTLRGSSCDPGCQGP